MTTKVLRILVKEALHEGSPTLSTHCLPRWAVSMSVFCTPGIEIKNTTIQGRREGMSRNQKSQLRRTLRNLALHLSWRPEFSWIHALWTCAGAEFFLVGQRFSSLTINSHVEAPSHSSPTILAYSCWHHGLWLPQCLTCILYLLMFLPSADSLLCV